MNLNASELAELAEILGIEENFDPRAEQQKILAKLSPAAREIIARWETRMAHLIGHLSSLAHEGTVALVSSGSSVQIARADGLSEELIGAAQAQYEDVQRQFVRALDHVKELVVKEAVVGVKDPGHVTEGDTLTADRDILWGELTETPGDTKVAIPAGAPVVVEGINRNPDTENGDSETLVLFVRLLDGDALYVNPEWFS